MIRHRRARRRSGAVSAPGTDRDDEEIGWDIVERVTDPIPLPIQGVSTPPQLGSLWP
jgi:hypothetical protein